MQFPECLRMCFQELGIRPGSQGNAETGDRPIHMAAKYGRNEVIKVLLENGGFVDELNNKGQTARKY